MLAIGNTVKKSGYALKPARDYWLGCGDYTRKNRAKEALDKATALRGIVTEISKGGCKVTWNDGTESNCLDYMVERVNP